MTDAEKRACAKYQRNKLKAITIRVKPEELARYKDAANKAGMSFRAWIMTSMDMAIEHASQIKK
jgi:predicted DNA binding CopG/RHH family protein